MQLEEFLSGLAPVEKASDDATMLWLRATVASERDRLKRTPICLEVGAWCGVSAVAMALGGGDVISVDPFDGRDSQCSMRIAELSGGSTLSRFRANVARSRVTEHVFPLVGTSPQVASVIPHGWVDLIFVDGDHALESVQADLFAWAPRVRAGGILCGHDASQHQVIGSVSSMLAQALGLRVEIVGGPADIWAVRIPGVGRNADAKLLTADS